MTNGDVYEGMTAEEVVWWEAGAAEPPDMTPDQLARVWRRTGILCGFVPIFEMTQAETDWAFRTAARLVG